MFEFVDADFLLLQFTGLAGIALGIWVFTLDPASRLNRVFSAILIIRSLAPLTGTIGFKMLGPDLRTGIAVLHSQPYLTVAFFPLIIYFLSIYPHPRGPFATRIGAWGLAAVTAGAAGWYALDHSIYTRISVTAGRLSFEDGPLLLLYGLRAPMMGLAGLILARDYRRRPAGSKGYSLFLLAAAFAVGAIFNGTLFTIQEWDKHWGTPLSSLWATPLTLSNAAQMLALPLGLAALIQMAFAVRHEATDTTLQEARRFVSYVAPAALLSGVVAALAQDLRLGETTLESTPILNFLMGFWGLLVPLMVTYSLLRFSLFDMDIRLKAGVRRGIVMAAFAATFFLVSESAEGVLGDGRGPLFGLVAAALLAVVARPLQTAAARAADRLMPDTAPLHLLSPRAREVMYLEQFLLVQADGQVTPKERRMLDDLAEAMHLDQAQMDRLETSGQTKGSTKAPPVPAPPQPTGWSARRGILVATSSALALGAFSAFLETLVPVSDFMMGLLSSALITVLLGPIERLAGRLAGEKPPTIDPGSLRFFNKELDFALSDGHWSRRDRRYLAGLAEHLGIDGATRRRLTRAALSGRRRASDGSTTV